MIECEEEYSITYTKLRDIRKEYFSLASSFLENKKSSFTVNITDIPTLKFIPRSAIF